MARRILTLVQNQPMRGGDTSLSRPWDSAIEGWLNWLKIGGLSANTRRLRYEHVHAIARRSGTHHPRELTLSLLVELCSSRNWSREYRRGVRTSFISFCEWCVANEMMDSNPAFQLPAVAADTPKPRPTPDDVWRDLLEAAPPREKLMARLAAEAGLRRSEVAQTRLDDLVHDGNGWALIVLGKGDKQRMVPITADLAAAIRAHVDHGYLFPGQVNGHISAAWAGACISRLMPPGWTMHRLRHRYASKGFAGTRNLRAVQEALGHASVATTERYTAITRDDVRAVSEAAGEDGNDVA
jgi:integrase